MTAQGAAVLSWLRSLQERLRRVRICCGDFRRVLTDVVTVRHGTTAVFLDPPYAVGSDLYSTAYGASDSRAYLAAWCAEYGESARIAICGHDGEYALPGWEAFAWKARGGYGNQGGADDEDNRHRETIWFSPACLGADALPLFSESRGLAVDARP